MASILSSALKAGKGLLSGGGGTALLSLGAGLLSKNSGDKAAKNAAAASQYATDQSIGLQRDQFNQTQANLSPYMQAGQTGLSALQAQAGQPMPTAYQDPGYTAPGAFKFSAADYTQSPGLQFALDRGVGAINSQAAHGGSMYSGKSLKDVGSFVANTLLDDYQQERGFAADQYTADRNFGRANYLDDRNFGQGQYTDARNYQGGVVSNLAGIGQNAAAGVGNAGMAFANNAGQALQQNAANAGNAGLVASSNFSSLLGQGVNSLAYTQRPTPAVNTYATNANFGFS